MTSPADQVADAATLYQRQRGVLDAPTIYLRVAAWNTRDWETVTGNTDPAVHQAALDILHARADQP